MDSLKSHLLLASPPLADENFYRTVVLLISHDEEGALGVILNRPSDVRFADLWMECTGNTCHASITLHRGGPVNGPPILLHDDMSKAEVELLPGVFLSTDESNIDWLVNHVPGNLRVFCGYAGWGPGQLESELEQGGWLITEANEAIVFSDDEEMWRTVAASIGEQVVFHDSPSTGTPIDPSLN